MYCPRCGAATTPGASFCSACGARVDGATPPPMPPRGIPVEQRREILRRHLARAAAMGGRIDTQGDFAAQVVMGKQVNHLLHFFIGLFTCGLWWVAWAIMGISGGEHRTTITVDEDGRAMYVGGNLSGPEQSMW